MWRVEGNIIAGEIEQLGIGTRPTGKPIRRLQVD